MAVRARVILTVFWLTGVVVVASIIATFWFGNRVLEAQAREELRREGIARIDQLESTISDAETGQRGFVITGDEAYLQPFNQASEHLASISMNFGTSPGSISMLMISGEFPR